MPNLLLLTLGCCLTLLVQAAPKDTYNENAVEENPAPFINVKAIQTSDTPTKEAKGGETPEIHNTDDETEYTKHTQETSTESQAETWLKHSTVDVEPTATQEAESKTAADKQTGSQSPSVETTSETRPTRGPTTKKPSVTTVQPLAEGSPTTSSVVSPSTTAKPTRRYPCRCAEGICSCCTGIILENFNVPIRSKACANITYEPEEFAFNFKLLYNNRLLYNTRMSAKNPPPACIPINRYFGIKMCAKLSNVYMSGRNVHACLDMEGYWDDESAFQYSFNCFRIGSGGVAVVRPEDGGGLPPPPDEEEQTDEDYDDSARGYVGDYEIVPN